MTNLVKFRGAAPFGGQIFVKNFALVLALLFVLTGCKKEAREDSAHFYFDANQEVFFEYGQSKSIRFSAHKIVSISVSGLPRGWDNQSPADGRIVVTAPTEAMLEINNVARSGEFTVSATAEDGTPFSQTITVTVKPAVNLGAPANSFIVSDPDARYKFEAKKGDGSALTGVAAKATLLWATSAEAIEHVALEDDGTISFSTGGYKSTGTVPDIFIDANALVAALDGDGNVLWSWHLWATANDPRTAPVTLAGKQVMDRNLGAFANSAATPDELVRSYGLFYQWGRKDPFVGPMAWDSTTPQPMYNAVGQYITHVFAVSDATVGTVETATANPLCFIAGAESSNYDWLFEARDNGLWSADEKTLSDPCPAGWTVASTDIWADFDVDFNTQTPAPGTDWFGWNFSTDDGGTTFFPAAGRRTFSPTLASIARNYTNIVHDEDGNGFPVGFYWASFAPEVANAMNAPTPQAQSLQFRHDMLDTAAKDNRAGGFPVRCAKID